MLGSPGTLGVYVQRHRAASAQERSGRSLLEDAKATTDSTRHFRGGLHHKSKHKFLLINEFKKSDTISRPCLRAHTVYLQVQDIAAANPPLRSIDLADTKYAYGALNLDEGKLLR